MKVEALRVVSEVEAASRLKNEVAFTSGGFELCSLLTAASEEVSKCSRTDGRREWHIVLRKYEDWHG